MGPGEERLSVTSGAGAQILNFESYSRRRKRRRTFRIAPRILSGGRAPALTACLVDVDATNDDPQLASILRLTVQRARFSISGKMLEAGEVRSWAGCNPSIAPFRLGVRASIADRSASSCAIADGEAYGLLTCADIIIATDAALARPLLERRLGMSGQAWICASSGLDWSAIPVHHGADTRLVEAEASARENTRIAALLRMLRSTSGDNVPVFAVLAAAAAKPTFALVAVDPPKSVMQELAARGYVHSPNERFWTRPLATTSEMISEKAWLSDQIYQNRRNMMVLKTITWRERFAREL